MSLLLGLFWGLLLGGGAAALEEAVRARAAASPDFVAAALALVLLQGPGRRPRRTAALVGGLLLGGSTGSLDPVGAFLLGGGIAAVVLVPLRTVVFHESATTQAVFGATAALALAAGRGLHALAGAAPALPWTLASLTTPLLTAAAVPILARIGSGLLRAWRGAWERGTPLGESPEESESAPKS